MNLPPVKGYVSHKKIQKIRIFPSVYLDSKRLSKYIRYTGTFSNYLWITRTCRSWRYRMVGVKPNYWKHTWVGQFLLMDYFAGLVVRVSLWLKVFFGKMVQLVGKHPKWMMFVPMAGWLLLLRKR